MAAFDDPDGPVNPESVVENLIQQQPGFQDQQSQINPELTLNRLIRKAGADQAKRLQAPKLAKPTEPQDFSSFGTPADEAPQVPKVPGQPQKTPESLGTGEDFSQFGTPTEKPAEDWPGYTSTASTELAGGAVHGAGAVLKGAGTLGSVPASRNIAATGDVMRRMKAKIAQGMSPDDARTEAIQDIRHGAARIDPRSTPSYQAGEATQKFGETTFPETEAQKKSIFAQGMRGVGSMGVILPAAAAASAIAGPEAGGAVIGTATGAGIMGAMSAADAFDAAIQKGATVEQAQKVAVAMGGAGTVLGALPLGVIFKPVARFLPVYPGLAGFAVKTLEHAAQSGVVFATVGEAQEFLAQQVALHYYDQNAAYQPDLRRIVSGLLTGAIVAGAHDVGSAAWARARRPAPAAPGPVPGLGAPAGGAEPGGPSAGPGAEAAGARPEPGAPRGPAGPPHPDSAGPQRRRRAVMADVLRWFDDPKHGSAGNLTQAHIDAMSNEELRNAVRDVKDVGAGGAKPSGAQQEPPQPQQPGPEAQQAPPEPPPHPGPEPGREQPRAESGPKQEYEAANAALREAGFKDWAIKRWSPETRAKRLRALGIEPRAPNEPAAAAPPEEQPAPQAQPGARQDAGGPENLTPEEFRVAARRGVLGPASHGEPPVRVQRPQIEPRGTRDSMIHHRDIGMNLGYSADDIAHYAAHNQARQTDRAYERAYNKWNVRGTEPKPSIPEAAIDAAHARLLEEERRFGPPKPASEATLRRMDELKSGGPIVDAVYTDIDEPPSDTGQNVPEAPETLRAQQQQLVAGERSVQMFPQGTQELPLPKGMERVATPRGVFHYNPKQISATRIRAQSSIGHENEFLGLGPVSKPEAQARAAAGEPPVAVVERQKDGTEVRAAAGTAQTAPAQQAAMEGAKSPGNAVGVETPAGVVAARQGTGTTFKTAKGSTYEVHQDGTTTRNKSVRADVGHEGDSGPKARSERTVYVDDARVASALSAAGIQNLGPKGARVIIKDRKASLLTWNDQANKWGRSPGSADIAVSDTPDVGKAPLELWKRADDVPGYEAYRGMHAGNKITAMGGATEAAQGTGTRADPVHLRTGEDVARAAAAADPDHTHAQGEANNATRGHAVWEGLPITFEAAAGGVRRGLNPKTGEPWESAVGAHTGYIRGTVAKDGDHLDIYFGEHAGTAEHPNSTAYVLDEMDKETGKYRQPKVFAWFQSPEEAVASYLRTGSKEIDEIGGMRSLSLDELKSWMSKPRNLRRPLSEAGKKAVQDAGKKQEPAAMPHEAAGPVGEAQAAPEAPSAEEHQPAEKAGTPADGRIEPEHYDAVETMLKTAGVDPARVPPVVIAQSAEIMRDEDRAAPDAFQIAAVRHDAVDEGMPPEQIEQLYGPDIAKAILHPQEAPNEKPAPLATREPSERGVRAPPLKSAAGGPATEVKGGQPARRSGGSEEVPASETGQGGERQPAVRGEPHAPGEAAGAGDHGGGERQAASVSEGTEGGQGEERATRAAQPSARRVINEPASLLPFIAAQGGLRPTPDLRHIGLDESTRAIAPNQGPRPVLRPDGLSLHDLTEKLRAEGYLREAPPDQPDDVTESEVLDLIDAELRGRKHYPIGREHEARQARESAEDESRAMAERDAAARLDEFLAEHHIPPDAVLPEDRALAAELMADHGLGPDDALERATITNELAGGMVERDAPHYDELEETFDEAQSHPAPGPREVPEAARGEGPGEGASEVPEAGKHPHGAGEARREEVAEPATEATPAGEQSVLPGAERISEGEQAQRAAEKPLAPKVAQKEPGGLFSDEAGQSDLVDMARKPAETEHPGLVIQSLETGKITHLQPPGTKKPRTFPSYTTAELQKAVDSPNTGAALKQKMRAEIEARQSGEAKPTVTPQVGGAGAWEQIGKNPIGQTIYEDQRGVRSYIENGVRHTEPVAMRPTRTGVALGVEHREPWLLEGETAGAAEPKPSNANASLEKEIDKGETIQDLINDEQEIADYLGSRQHAKHNNRWVEHAKEEGRGDLGITEALKSGSPDAMWAAVDAWAAREPEILDLQPDSQKTLLRQMVHAESLLTHGGKYHYDVESRSPKFKRERDLAQKSYDGLREKVGLQKMGVGFSDTAWAWKFFGAQDRPGYQPLTAKDVATLLELHNKPANFSLNKRTRAEIVAEVLRDIEPEGVSHEGRPGTEGAAPLAEVAPAEVRPVEEGGELSSGATDRGTSGTRGDGTPETSGGEAVRGGGDRAEGVHPAAPRAGSRNTKGPRGGVGREGEVASGAPASGPDRVAPEEAPNLPKQNFRITDETGLGQGSEGVKFKDNLNAITILKALERDDRRATPDEQRALARYVGWGGLANAFADDKGEFKPDWQKRGEQLAALLTPEETRTARRSTRNAHYTSKDVIDAMWNAVDRMGFRGGIALELSSGTGNFLGLVPDRLAGRTRFIGVENDSLTQRIAQQLYPQDTILHSGLQHVPLPEGEAVLNIGNPPFGAESLRFRFHPEYNGLSIHNQFFLAGLDALQPGGIHAAVVSRYLLDAQDTKARQEMAVRADLLGAIRLPETAFKENARTEVVTDIVFMRRRQPEDQAEMRRIFDQLADRKIEKENRQALEARIPDWVNTTAVKDPLGGEEITVNRYFANRPAMIMGSLERSGSMRQGADVTVKMEKGADLAKLLDEAVQKLPKDILHQDQDVIGASLARHERMARGLEIAVRGHEPGHIETKGDRLNQIYERETPTGGYELAERELTPATPWSRQLKEDSQGRWYTLEPRLGEKGEKVKQEGSTRLVYDRKYFPNNEVPPGLRLGITRLKRLQEAVALRDLTRKQIVLETEDAPAKAMEANRQALAAAYQKFTKRHGLLNEPSNAALVSDMPDGALVMALELNFRRGVSEARAKRLNEKPKPPSADPAPIMRTRVVPKFEPVQKVKTPQDALAVSLSDLGRVDIPRIAGLLDISEEDAAARMQEGDTPLVYQDPESNTWETRDAYLSGQVARKLRAAKGAGLDRNVRDLEKVQPARWTADQVNVILGASWVPPKVYGAFAEHMVGGRGIVQHLPITNSFSVDIKNMDDAKHRQWRTDDARFEWLLSRILNSQPVKIIREDSEGKKHVDEEATALAQLKAREIHNEFADWIFRDADRRNSLVDMFNEKFNTRVNRQFDGSHLQLPGKVPDTIVSLRRNQKNATWRGMQQRSILLDHVVGAGKTFAAITRIMERRRVGLSRKPMVAVPNHLVTQWTQDFLKLYPGAKVLAASANQFDRANRRKLFAKIATGDWDAVIVPHSSFGFIGISPETELRFLDHELRLAVEAIEEAQKQAEAEGIAGGRRKPFNVKEAERLAEKLENRIDALKNVKRDRLLTFEQMGIDDLTVDEAHEFKNLMYSSRLVGVRGMGNKTGSAKALDLYTKIRVLNEMPTGSVAFLTGTPISNSAVEMYTVLRYLAPNELKELGLENFDAWRTQSVTAEARFEPTESGSDLKEVTRLGRSWSNMRALMELWRSVSDSVTQEDMNKWYAEDNKGERFPVPPVKGGGRKEVIVKPTPAQQEVLNDVVAGFNGLKNISDPFERNKARLRLMDRARKVSLDVRAANPRSASKEEGGKLEVMADNVARIHKQWTPDAGTQLVFLDRSVRAAKGDDKAIKEYDALVQSRDKAIQDGDEAAFQKIADALDKFDPNEIEELRRAQAGGWNAYDQLKQNLIARGVPADEIRFVQEANNDVEKQALFDAVNDGLVRVLIGSTQRMGAGTNVQQRLVALHHGDVTWKPSDIEQREGRIIRQGNDLLKKYGKVGHNGGPPFEVEILAYATERTVDAKMWDLNATKLRMVNGVRKYDGAFTMEFDDEDAVGMAEIAALASGDPMLLERVKLQSEIDKLELLERAHRRKMFGVEDRIHDTERQIEQLPARIKRERAQSSELNERVAGLQTAAEKRSIEVEGTKVSSPFEAHKAAEAAIKEQQAGNENAKYAVNVGGKRLTNKADIEDAIRGSLGDGMPFEMTIGGKPVITRAAAAKAIADKAHDLSKKVTAGGDHESERIGKMLGYDLDLEVSADQYRNRIIGLHLDKAGQTVASGQHKRGDAMFTPAGARAAIDDLEKHVKELSYDRSKSMEQGLEQAKRELPALMKERGQPFKQAPELSEKRKRLEEVIRELAGRAEAAEKGGPKGPDTPPSGGGAPRPMEFAHAAPAVSVTETPEFQQWFRDSKVVDEGGQPLRAYHGSIHDFEVFDTRRQPKARSSRAWSGDLGSWFAAPSKSQGNYDEGNAEYQAGSYAEDRKALEFAPGANVKPVYLSIKNPKEYQDWEEFYDDRHEDGQRLTAEAFRAKLIADGHDGLVIRNSETDGDVDRDDWVAFEPTQIKSATGNRGTFDPNDPRIFAHAADAGLSGLYSAVEKAIRETPQEKAAPSQWLGLLRNKPGIKEEELKWLGLREWLGQQEGPVTRQAVLDYVRANQLQFKEVTKGGDAPVSEQSIQAVRDWLDATMRDDELNDPARGLNLSGREDIIRGLRNRDRNAISDLEGLGAPDELIEPFSGYRGALPTDIDEWEMGETVPLERGETQTIVRHPSLRPDTYISILHSEDGEAISYEPVVDGHAESNWDTFDSAVHAMSGVLSQEEGGIGTSFGQYRLPGGERYREVLVTLPEVTKTDAARQAELRAKPIETLTQTEREELSNIARGRGVAGDRRMFTGSHWSEPNVVAHVRFDDRTGPNGEKILHVAEFQSDWAAKIRRENESDVMDARHPTPEGPFVGSTDSWVPLVLKRMLRYAAENGYDRLSWDSGETNADRYDLSKQVKRLQYIEANGTLGGWDHNGQIVIKESGILPARLPDYVGKSVAERLMEQEPGSVTGIRQLDGVDLTIDSEEAKGQKKFYDEMLPAMARKLVRPFGGEVGRGAVTARPTTVEIDRHVEKHGYPPEEKSVPVHSIPITPSMRAGIMEKGFPLFHKAIPIPRDRLPQAYQQRLAQVEKIIRDLISQQVGGHVKVQFPFRIDPTSQPHGYADARVDTIFGSYTTMERVIKVALAHGDPRILLETAFHEPFHAIQDFLASDRERALLKASLPALRDLVRRHPRHGVGADTYAPYEIEAMAYQIYGAERAADGSGTNSGLHVGIRRLFEKIYQFFRRLMNAMRGLGFQTWEDFFGKAYEGGLKGREARPGSRLTEEVLGPEEINRRLNEVRGTQAAHAAREGGLPAKTEAISSHTDPAVLKAHSDYTAAKAGNVEAAARLVEAMVKPQTFKEALDRFGTDAIYAPVVAEEATGPNKIPRALAELYAARTGADTAKGLVQVTRAFHTGAKAMERLLVRPEFDGPVRPGGRYVLVDDVTVMGSTLAELSHHITAGGGQVLGVVTLVNASRTGVLSPRPGQIREIGRRFGNAVRDLFRIEPGALTGVEATYLLNFRDADALRARADAAGRQRGERLAAKGISPAPVTLAHGGGRPPPPPPTGGPPPTWNERVRDRIQSTIESELGTRFIENFSNLSHRVRILQNVIEQRFEAQGLVPAGSNSGEPITRERYGRGSALPDAKQFYSKKRLFPGKVGNVVGKFNKSHLDPLVKYMKANGIKLKDAGDYLYALHADERNEALADYYDASHPFAQALHDPDIVGASGMSSNQAQEIIDRIEGGPNGGAYPEFLRKIAAVRDYNNETLVHYGLEPEARVGAWQESYENYVPLRGWEDAPDEAPPNYGIGAQFNVRGPEVRQALGRRSKADNPLVNLLDQSYRFIERGERNRYLISLASALSALSFEHRSDIATLNQGRSKRVINPKTGLVETIDDYTDRHRPEAVHYKVRGEAKYIVFKDRKVADAVKRMNPYGVGSATIMLRAVNKLKALWTHANPEFLLRHFFFRYPIEGLLNAQELRETGDFSTLRYLKDAFPMWGRATQAILAAEMGRPVLPQHAQLRTYWEEMKREGGAMTFRQMRDVDLLREHMQTMLRDLTGRPDLSVRQRLRHFVEGMDRYTNAMDNSLRLAIYAQARDQGMSPQQASLHARDATIDYQLRARWSNIMGLIFPFYNTAMRTGARMSGALVRSRVMRGVFFGVMGAGLMLSLWNYLVGNDPNDGVPWFEKVAPWDREGNLIIMNPFTSDGRPQPIKLPMPYNYRHAYNLGKVIASAFMGKESWGERFMSLLRTTWTAFTPVGETSNYLDYIVPEVLRTPAHIIENRTWTGARLHQDEMFQKFPNAYSPMKGPRGAPGIWQSIAAGINTATGGSRQHEGLIDLHPEDYREIFDQFFGAQRRLVEAVGGVGSSVMKGELPKPADVPMTRVFYGTDYEKAAAAEAAHRKYLSNHPWKR